MLYAFLGFFELTHADGFVASARSTIAAGGCTKLRLKLP
jgi:hypothetical protein